MSALTDPKGFKLTTLVEAQRGMTESEMIRYLETGVLPDLSKPPVDVGNIADLSPDRQVLPLDVVTDWLAGKYPDALVASVLGFKFNPNQPRDSDGKWTEGAPGVSAPDFKSPSGMGSAPNQASPAGKKITPAVIYKKHADGTVVAESGDRRMRWDAGAKKFVVEERQSSSWVEISRLTKSAAYEDVKAPGRWFEHKLNDAPQATTTPTLANNETNNIQPNFLATSVPKIDVSSPPEKGTLEYTKWRSKIRAESSENKYQFAKRGSAEQELVDFVDEWAGNFDQVDIRNEIKSGKWDNVVRAIRSGERAPTLFRLSKPRGDISPGTEIDLGDVSSFSGSKLHSESFMKYGANKTGDVLLVETSNARGLSIAGISSTPYEDEWLIGGKLVVTSVSRSPRADGVDGEVIHAKTNWVINPGEDATTAPPQTPQLATADSQPTAKTTSDKFFTSTDQVKSWVAAQNFPKPGQHAESALKFYGEKGYQHINSWLRNGTSKSLGAQDAFDIQKHMKNSRTKTPITVSRMTETFAFSEPLDQLVGKIIADKGFVSTTALPTAKHFQGNQWWTSKDVNMIIDVPAGARAVHMDPFATVKGQHEILLDANTKMEITSAHQEVSGKWTVTAKVLL